MFGLKPVSAPQLHVMKGEMVIVNGVAYEGSDGPVKLLKPAPIKVELAPLPDMSEYEEIGRVLGFHPPELEQQKAEVRRRELIEFCLDNGYPIYDNQHVHDYMSGLAKKVKKIFVWCPVDRAPREADYMRRHMLYINDAAEHGTIVGEQYSHAIPIDILRRAAAMKAAIPEVRIYASDYAIPNPDPFIAARLGQGKLVIFGVWDEPGFAAIGRDVK